MPAFTNRAPHDIITDKLFYDSAGFVYRGLSWWDYAKRNGSSVTLQYAALETRQAIEQLFFEELIMSVGVRLDQKEYEKCKGHSTQLKKIIQRLSPVYQSLVAFTKAISSLIPDSPTLIEWDHEVLLKHWGILSQCLHWAGEPRETFNSPAWLAKALEDIERAALYIWKKLESGVSGVMLPANMEPEIRHLWEDYKAQRITLGVVKERAGIALPVLAMRKKT